MALYYIHINKAERVMDQELIDRVVEQIKQDVGNADYTAIEELLQSVPEHLLIGFLIEE